MDRGANGQVASAERRRFGNVRSAADESIFLAVEQIQAHGDKASNALRVDQTGPVRTGRAARVRAGFGRAALAIGCDEGLVEAMCLLTRSA
jgi:hypothetical protein